MSRARDWLHHPFIAVMNGISLFITKKACKAASYGIAMGLMEPAQDNPESSERPREKIKRAVVRCKAFQCEAVLWSDGKWRDTHDDELEVLEVQYELPL